MKRISRTAAIAAAVGIQAVLVVGAVAPRLSARLTGEEYLLRVEPVDPIDPFRGAYVTLAYPDLASPERTPFGDDDVFVRLVRDGDVWRGGGVTSQRPDDGPYIACQDGYRLRCGIESLFASQAEARSLERDLASGGAVARIKVDRRGNAIVLGLIRGAEH
ncbi:MAG TPA: GDYXXLXY domain-containing protein [Mycobacteriales bacterium]|nr:GDYXXLXY domain-containing protein [Mycobacteriales bacterium]